jgi:hypothetical protein
MKKILTAMAMVSMATFSLAACGGDDDGEGGDGDGDAIVGEWGTSVPAGMGGEGGDDPPMDVTSVFAADGTGTITIEMMAEITVEVVFDADWTLLDSGSYQVDLECASVTPELPEFGLSCDEFGSDTLECTLNDAGDVFDCPDDDPEDMGMTFTKQ